MAGGQVNGFSPKHKLNTVVMNRSSTGKETMRLPLKSKVDSCKYEISERTKTQEYSFNIHVVDVDDFTAETLDAAARPQKSKNMHSFSARLSRISSSVTPTLGSKILGIGVKNGGQTLIPFLVS